MSGLGAQGALFIGAMLAAAPAAWAGIPVHDAPAQALRARQLAAAREHLEKAKEIVFTLRGVSGYGGALPSLDDMHMAPTLEEVKRVFANLAGGGSGVSGIEEVRRRSRVPLAEDLPDGRVISTSESRQRFNERVRLGAYYQLRGEQAYLLAERRRPALTGLQDALEQAGEAKEVLDLQTLVLIEIAHQLNDNNQLLATLLQLQAHWELLRMTDGIRADFLE